MPTLAANFEVDFTTANSIRTVLRFNAQVYKSGYHDSEKIVNIMNVSSLIITSDKIGPSYKNGATENIVYSFYPNVSPGYNVIYLPISLQTLSSMETKLQDQNGKLINLRGEKLSTRFHIKEV